MAARHGLQLLHEGDEPVADIVLVHGLFGDPQKTWTGSGSADAGACSPSLNDAEPNDANRTRGMRKRKSWAFWGRNRGHDNIVGTASSEAFTEHGVFWPKELLPRAIPHTRIFTWGYDVDVNNVFSAASQATVFQHAATLLSDIANKRTSSTEKLRPLIFVAHSLGGIVVKDMLNASRNEVTYLKDVLPATYGIVFLGTPHRGSSVATLGKIAQDISKILWKSPNMSLLRDLEVNSQTLDRVSRGFNQILVECPIEIHSFREELPTKGIMAGFFVIVQKRGVRANGKLQVVNQFSSSLEHGREIVDMIPANHENMTKFSSPFDIGFIRIIGTLIRWLDDIKSKSSNNAIDSERISEQFTNKLDDLHSWLGPEPFELELTRLLDRRAPNTQNHLLDQSVASWFQSDRGLLQIIGDSGYGKTMAAASIIERASSNGASKSFIGYAFCLKLKVNAVLQGLVWQIVQNHYLTVDQKLLILEAHRTRVRLPSDHMTQTERQEMLDLRNLIAKLLQPYKSVTLAFDGVDQATFPEDIVACISNIADSLLSSVKPFKLLVTSRQQSRGLRINDDQLRLHHLSLTSRDVTCDTEIFMRRLLSSLEPPLDAGLETVVVQKCLEAADGWPDFMHTLATKYVELGRPNEAEALELEVLSFREARQRENSEPILYSKRLLALILAEQGRLDRAEELQRSLLEISKRTRRDGDDLIRTFTNDLSLTLTHRDAAPEKKREAITLLEQIIDAWKTPEGDETEKSLTVANNLAVAYMEVDRLEEGEALMHRAIAGSALLHGENSRASLAHKCNLAQLYARQKRWAEAEALDLEVLEVRKRTLGMDNPITIQCMSSIGWAYSQQGRLEEAKEFQLQVLERRMRLQGATHPDTIGILGNLAETVAKLGEMNDARRYARMALGY